MKYVLLILAITGCGKIPGISASGTIVATAQASPNPSPSTSPLASPAASVSPSPSPSASPSPSPSPLPVCEAITPISASYYGVDIPILFGGVEQLYEQFSCNGSTVKKIFPFPGVEDWCAQYTTPWEGEYNICVGYPISVSYTNGQVCLQALFYVGSSTMQLAAEISSDTEYCGTYIAEDGSLQ